jgi:hypothetical protein
VHPHGLELGQRARDAVNVGEPPHCLLELGVGVFDHLRVETQARHHEECVLLGVAVGAGDLRDAEVNGPVGSREGGGDRRVEVGERQIEVSGEQVAGATRQHGHRDARVSQGLGDSSHGAVAARREHHGRTTANRGLGDTLARVILGGLEPRGCSPPGLLGGIGDRFAELVGVDLDRVVDDSSYRFLLAVRAVRHES